MDHFGNRGSDSSDVMMTGGSSGLGNSIPPINMYAVHMPADDFIFEERINNNKDFLT